jgi:serine/threonine protein kinase/tetratricopeptide (TPR) repeat protein
LRAFEYWCGAWYPGAVPESHDAVTLPSADSLADEPGGGAFFRGDSAGRYVILHQIGAGGMGVVYAAYDPELDRRIALKILNPRSRGAGTERGHRRLLQEAQAMARLSHPNVIAVHDVGALEDSVFVAMEFVEGQTVRRWAREKPRTWPELREVFLQAAEGLAAAHDADLVHRDFKPENVMIGSDGRVRVLDFGLAQDIYPGSSRASGSRSDAPAERAPSLEPQTTHEGETTSPESFASHVRGGTPAYMSPEQHSGLRADPRSDQYSFCVALYEAAFGRLPYEGRSAIELGVQILEGELIPAPADSDLPAKVRAAIMRGLSLDAEQRWPSMRELQAELRPLAPRSRMRGWMTGAVLIGGVGLAFALGRMPSEESRPCQAAGSQMAELWNDDARTAISSSLAQASSTYGSGTWQRLEPRIDGYAGAWTAMQIENCEATEVHQTQSSELMDLRAACLERRRNEFAALLALFADADGTVVEHAVEAAASLPALEKCADAEALRSRIAPPADPATRKAVEDLRERMGKLDALRWSGRARDALPIATALMEESEAIDYPPLQAELRFRLGVLQEMNGEYDAAAANLESAYRVATLVGDERLATHAVQRVTLVVGHRQQRHEESLIWAKVAGALSEHLDPDGREVATALSHEGLVHQSRGDQRTALERQRRAVQILRGLAEVDEGDLAAGINNLAMTLRTLGEVDEAESLNREVLKIRERTLGERHPLVGSTLHNLALIHTQRGEYDEALALETRALELLRESLGEHAPRVSTSYASMAIIHDNLGHFEDAMEYYARALAGLRTQLGENHPTVADMILNIGAAYYVHGDIEEAEIRYLAALETYESKLGPDHPAVAIAVGNLAEVEERRENWKDAEALYRRALKIALARHGERHPSIPFPRLGLGRALLEQGRSKEALEELELANEINESFQGDPLFRADLHFALARALRATGKDPDRARKFAEGALLTYTDSPLTHAEAETQVRRWLAK